MHGGLEYLLLIGLIDAAAVGEFDAGFGDQAVVLLVAEAADRWAPALRSCAEEAYIPCLLRDAVVPKSLDPWVDFS